MDGKIRRLEEINHYLQKEVNLKAEEIQRSYDENRKLEMEYGAKLHELQRESQQLREELQKSNETNKLLKDANIKLVQRRPSVGEQGRRREDAFHQSEGGIQLVSPESDPRQEVSRLNAMVGRFSEKNRTLQSEKLKVQSMLESVRKTNNDLLKEKERLETYCENLKSTYELKCKNYESLVVRANEPERERELKHREEKVEADRKDIHEQRERLASFRKQAADEKQELTTEINQLTMENEKLTEKNRELQQALKHYKGRTNPDVSLPSYHSPPYRSHSDRQLTVEQEIDQLKKQMYMMQNNFSKVQDRYERAAGRLQTTMHSRRDYHGQRDNELFEALEMLMEIGRSRRQRRDDYYYSPLVSRESYFPSDRMTPIPSQYPPITPFSQDTHHHIVDLSKLDIADEKDKSE